MTFFELINTAPRMDTDIIAFFITVHCLHVMSITVIMQNDWTSHRSKDFQQVISMRKWAPDMSGAPWAGGNTQTYY